METDAALLQEAFAILAGKLEQAPTREHLTSLHTYYWGMLNRTLARLEEANRKASGESLNA
jgi:hypothetical protein